MRGHCACGAGGRRHNGAGAACGAGVNDYPPLALLPAADLSPARKIVLLVVDGLGYDYLRRQLPDGALSRHLRGRMDSVFPTTTAAAITTLLTGVAKSTTS